MDPVMKHVVAYVRPHRFDKVELELRKIPNITGITVSDVRGWGHAKLKAQEADHGEGVRDFDSYTRIEVFCLDEAVPIILDSIQSAAHTGLLGDGKIYVSTIDEAVRIRSGERGEDAC